EPMFAAIQSSLDELARMREHVAKGQRVAPARALIARLQALSRPGGAAAAAVEPAATAPPPPPAPVSVSAPPPPAAELELVYEAEAPAPSPEPQDEEIVLSPDEEIVDTGLARLNAELMRARSEAIAGETAPEPAAPAESAAAAAEESSLEQTFVAPVPPGREPVPTGERVEMARVDAELLDQLLNISGEASIARARLEQQLGSFDFNLGELSRTVTRLKEQLRHLEIETEAQILHKHEDEAGSHRSDFDPLELDRYSSIQQYSRALAETANDVASIQGLLENLAKDTQNLLQQQARTITELQNGLMRTRMVPFQRHVQRLARIVRQAAADTGKRAELSVEGASGELDRQVL